MPVKVRPRYVYATQTKNEETGTGVTWDELLARFLASKAKRTEKYQYDLNNSLKRAHKALEGAGVQRPCQITKRAAKMFLAQYKAQGVSDQTVNHMTQKLLTEFTWAYEEEIFDTDKLATLKKIAIQDKLAHVSVTIDEINAIILQIYDDWLEENAPASRFRGENARNFFPTRDVCMTLWMADTGARVGETARILRADIDLEARSALLRHTKNGDDRLVYFNKEFRDGILAEWLEIRDSLDTMCDNLYISELGLPLNPYRWGRQWDKYRQRAGIERRIRRHDLRHFSSQAHDRVSKDASKKQMGHRTDQAHEIYSDGTLSDRERDELREAHDKANPIGAILVRLAEERTAKSVAVAKPVQKRVYTK